MSVVAESRIACEFIQAVMREDAEELAEAYGVGLAEFSDDRQHAVLTTRAGTENGLIEALHDDCMVRNVERLDA